MSSLIPSLVFGQRGTRLRVFVSSDGSLADEREAAREAIESVGLIPVMYEDWGAIDKPMERAYLEQVRASDIYIGLFQRKYSKPTEDEFREAGNIRIPRFIYLRQGKRKPEKNLAEFVRQISNPQEGLIYKPYTSLRELREWIRNNLIDFLCENAKEGLNRALLAADSDKVISREIPLAQVREFESDVSPGVIKAGERLKIRIRFSGSLTNGLATAQIVHKSSRFAFWTPNGDTWNPYLDLGLVNGPMEGRVFEWVIEIPPWILPGKIGVSPGIWEDPLGRPAKDRRVVSLGSHEVTVRESQDIIARDLVEVYRKILNRDPDQIGIRDWYNAIASKQVDLGRMLVDGFLKSPEFRVEILHKAFSIDCPSDDRKHWVKMIQQGAASIQNVIGHLYSVALAGGGLPKKQIDAAVKVSERLGASLMHEDDFTSILEGAVAERSRILPFAVVRTLNSDRFIINMIFKCTKGEFQSPYEVTSVQEELSRAGDRFGFFWALWKKSIVESGPSDETSQIPKL